MSYNICMRRYIEIISIALISSYITLAVLYLINNEIFQDISISNNSEEAIINSVNKDLSDLEEELSNLIVKVDSIETSLDAINIQDRSEVTVSEGVSAEVPQEFLNKVDQLIIEINQEKICLDSFINFYLEQMTGLRTIRKVESGTVNIAPLIPGKSYLPREVLSDEFDC